MRATIIKLHLFVAAFFAPILLMVAVSGGLYLIGSKGTTERITLMVPCYHNWANPLISNI